MYIHSTNNKIDKIRTVRQRITFKPTGIWFAKNKDWINWSKKNLSNKIYKYNYRITFHQTKFDIRDKDKVLMIKTFDDLVKFTIKFGKKHKSVIFDHIFIDWKTVSKYYGGIWIGKLSHDANDEIKKVFKCKERCSLWTYTLDIASGCIWNKLAIKKLEKI